MKYVREHNGPQPPFLAHTATYSQSRKHCNRFTTQRPPVQADTVAEVYSLGHTTRARTFRNNGRGQGVNFASYIAGDPSTQGEKPTMPQGGQMPAAMALELQGLATRQKDASERRLGRYKLALRAP